MLYYCQVNNCCKYKHIIDDSRPICVNTSGSSLAGNLTVYNFKSFQFFNKTESESLVLTYIALRRDTCSYHIILFSILYIDYIGTYLHYVKLNINKTILL